MRLLASARPVRGDGAGVIGVGELAQVYCGFDGSNGVTRLQVYWTPPYVNVQLAGGCPSWPG